ncbi:binding protein [[Candida] boidinii]|nr:binding protein [[Candida] boidinii]
MSKISSSAKPLILTSNRRNKVRQNMKTRSKMASTIVASPQTIMESNIIEYETDKTYICPFEKCGKKFKRKDHLTRHKRNHTNMKLKCEICDAMFARSDLLRRHLNRHKEKEDKGDKLVTRIKLWSAETGYISQHKKRKLLQEIEDVPSFKNLSSVVLNKQKLDSDKSCSPTDTSVALNTKSDENDQNSENSHELSIIPSNKLNSISLKKTESITSVELQKSVSLKSVTSQLTNLSSVSSPDNILEITETIEDIDTASSNVAKINTLRMTKAHVQDKHREANDNIETQRLDTMEDSAMLNEESNENHGLQLYHHLDNKVISSPESIISLRFSDSTGNNKRKLINNNNNYNSQQNEKHQNGFQSNVYFTAGQSKENDLQTKDVTQAAVIDFDQQNGISQSSDTNLGNNNNNNLDDGRNIRNSSVASNTNIDLLEETMKDPIGDILHEFGKSFATVKDYNWIFEDFEVFPSVFNDDKDNDIDENNNLIGNGNGNSNNNNFESINSNNDNNNNFNGNGDNNNNYFNYSTNQYQYNNYNGSNNENNNNINMTDIPYKHSVNNQFENNMNNLSSNSNNRTNTSDSKSNNNNSLNTSSRYQDNDSKNFDSISVTSSENNNNLSDYNNKFSGNTNSIQIQSYSKYPPNNDTNISNNINNNIGNLNGTNSFNANNNKLSSTVQNRQHNQRRYSKSGKILQNKKMDSALVNRYNFESMHWNEQKLPLVTEYTRTNLYEYIHKITSKENNEFSLNIDDEFFELSSLQEFLDLYFTKVNVTYPIIHCATFDTESSSSLLLTSMIILGASYSTKLAHKVAVEIHDVLRGALFSSEAFTSEPELWVLQSMLLIEVFGKFKAGSKQHEMSIIFHGVLINLLKKTGCLNVQVPSYSSKDELDPESSWKNWIQLESMKRLAIFTFNWDVQHAILFGQTPCISAFELRLQLPSEVNLWTQSNSEDWLKFRREETEQIYFLNCLKKYLNCSNDLPSINPLSRVVTLYGLMSISWDMNRKELTSFDSNIDSYSWKCRMSKSFDCWKQDFDNFYFKISQNSRDTLNKRFLIQYLTTNSALYHVAHIALWTNINSLLIYSGSTSIFGRKVTKQNYEFAVQTTRTWSKSIGRSEKAVAHAIELLKEGFINLLDWEADGTLHYSWCLFIASLVSFCFFDSLKDDSLLVKNNTKYGHRGNKTNEGNNDKDQKGVEVGADGNIINGGLVSSNSKTDSSRSTLASSYVVRSRSHDSNEYEFRNQRESLANFLLTVSHQPLDKLRYLQIDPIVILKDMIKHFQSVRSGIIYDAMIIFKNILEKYEKKRNDGNSTENSARESNNSVNNSNGNEDFRSNSGININLSSDKKTNTFNPDFFAPKAVQKIQGINSTNKDGGNGNEKFFDSNRMLNSTSKIELGNSRDSQISQLFGPTDSEMKKHSVSSINTITNINNVNGNSNGKRASSSTDTDTDNSMFSKANPIDSSPVDEDTEMKFDESNKLEINLSGVGKDSNSTCFNSDKNLDDLTNVVGINSTAAHVETSNISKPITTTASTA